MKHLGLILLLLFMAGCNVAPGSEATINLETDSTAEETAAITAESATLPEDWQTHTDTTVGFTFSYPAGWELVAANTEGALMYSISLQSEPFAEGGAEGIAEDVTKIDVNVDNSRTYDDLDAATPSGETRTLINGREVLFTVSEDQRTGGDITAAYTLINDHLVAMVMFNGDSTIFWQIIESLQPA